MMHKAWCGLGEMPYCFSRSSVKFQGHRGQKNRLFWSELGVSRLTLNSLMAMKWCTKLDGYEMMHIDDVSYCLSRSSIKFQGHREKKSPIVTRIWRFWTVTRVWIYQWLWNDSTGEMPYSSSRSSIKFLGHTGQKLYDFNPIWVRLLCRSQLSNPSDLPCFPSSHVCWGLSEGTKHAVHSTNDLVQATPPLPPAINIF